MIDFPIGGVTGIGPHQLANRCLHVGQCRHGLLMVIARRATSHRLIISPNQTDHAWALTILRHCSSMRVKQYPGGESHRLAWSMRR
jgi:hypothetical protein